MKKAIITALAVISMFALSSCATTRYYTLGDVNSNISHLSGRSYDPLVAKPIRIVNTSIGKYDNFFDVVNKSKITVDLTQNLLKAFAKKIEKKEDPTEEAFALAYLIDAVIALSTDIPAQLENGANLTSSVNTDFTGLNMSKAPSTVAALQDAITTLNQMATTVKELTEEFKRWKSIIDEQNAKKK